MALSAGDQLLVDHLSGHSTGQGNSKGRFSIVGQHCLARGGPITWGSQLSVFHSAAPHRWRPVLGVDKQSSAPGEWLNYTATKVTSHLCCFPVI